MKKLYIVKWDDAWADLGSYRRGYDYCPLETMDIGWVVEENDEVIHESMEPPFS